MSIEYSEKEDSEGKLHISLKCKHCGEPIDQCSEEFGMDCKNHCMEKEYRGE